MKPIPEGYTYIRCDQYSAEEFIKRHTDRSGVMTEICHRYVLDNPKPFYNTDDDIALMQLHDEHVVGSMYSLTGKRTTKRYHYEQF